MDGLATEMDVNAILGLDLRLNHNVIIDAEYQYAFNVNHALQQTLQISVQFRL